ncbi:DNA methyltransferase [Salinibacter phage M1EM-1]|uniref:DNA modification methylase n=1 Tax=Salinibacter phage M1EM-1 TaxID=2681616 RepID=A0A2I6UG08_9CAUD|nr:DNA methyltransferase [Salinibacter phage M1EM-1]AUO78914.1 DNA modification methylase [Salinibacter phage M1EM-1]
MDPYHETGNIRVYHGSCEEVLAALDLSVSAVVTDPPYGLAFMGRDWDDFEPREYQQFCEGWAASVRESMRPGAPLLAFSGTRTFHRAICGIEDAGFTVKDCLSWTYGSGLPKSHDISKAIEKAAGAEREVVGENQWAGQNGTENTNTYGDAGRAPETAPATDEAERWDGYGTALAPSWEPICYATNPRENTYAENAQEHGVAGLNIDGGRIETEEDLSFSTANPDDSTRYGDSRTKGNEQHDGGRWPANVVLDEVAAEQLDGQSGVLESGGLKPSHADNNRQDKYGEFSGGNQRNGNWEANSGSASRFFYTAKASSSDRNAGLPDGRENDWPTVKPTDLMGWLLRLVEMPSDNLILDPFAGSGTTAYVAQQMGLPCVAIDQSEEACELTKERLSTPSLFS